MNQYQDARGSLSWAIRESLIRYVTVIAGGSFDVDGVEIDDEGRLVFPLRRAVFVDDEWHLYFSGSVHFKAHHGYLDILVADPEIILGTGGGALATRTSNEDQPMMPLALLDPSVPITSGGGHTWTGVGSRLMASGVEFFGGVYEEGLQMAPLKIVTNHLDS